VSDLLSPFALDELRARHPVDQVVGRYGVQLRRQGRGLVGPCPICSPDPTSRDATRFEVIEGGRKWVCAACENGGDAIELVMRVDRVDFRTAVNVLGGAAIELDPAEQARRDLEAAERRARDAEREAARKVAQRGKAKAIWDGTSRRAWHPLLMRYFEARAIPPRLIPPTLRIHEALPYWWTPPGEARPQVVHEGPAMVGIIRTNELAFIGAHVTWLAADGAGKATLVAPDGSPLKAKKIRGEHKGGAIHLAAPAEVLLIGEGIETALSAAAMLPHDEFNRPLFHGRPATPWSGISLGNLAGRTLRSIYRPHPDRPNGPPIAGDVPDLEFPGLLPPAWATTCVLLGDGDSDELDTAAKLMAAAMRWRADGREIRTAWSPRGKDFNDILREKGRPA
jgi:hypothetical protein